ncbi:DUF4169 family protein [Pukyongiella litopenaei]|uniref:DUF4169 family protein n=1 Tax=Pukyongiella litopenaei TaxID=2605946 RepID=A0A2S0MNQ4_9RHOB|nr:DUF4169 family protein [Pukyongiella litopenaei]AVO37343.1 DUF4169 family protein [Pukyongiella litopenaei]
MADPVNLNRYRKARARQEAREQADRNAAFHGLSKARKKRARAEEDLKTRRHEAGRIEPPAGDT